RCAGSTSASPARSAWWTAPSTTARHLGEPLDHQRLPYLLCAACLVTPSSLTISCHDKPCTRALRACTGTTWSAAPSERVHPCVAYLHRLQAFQQLAQGRHSAQSTRGSSAPAAVARSVASPMVSTHVDTSDASAKVDTRRAARRSSP